MKSNYCGIKRVQQNLEQAYVYQKVYVPVL